VGTGRRAGSLLDWLAASSHIRIVPMSVAIPHSPTPFALARRQRHICRMPKE
jgi:hypothetical protein